MACTETRRCRRILAGAVGVEAPLAYLRTCDDDAPRLIVHADTTAANVHAAMRTELIHRALAAKGIAPAVHLVDSAYVSAAHLVAARETFAIDLVGPPRKNLSWQQRQGGSFRAADFQIDWEASRALCPCGKESQSWCRYRDKSRNPYVKVRFNPADCRACEARAQCTRATGETWGRNLRLRPRDEYEALATARTRKEMDSERPLYALRQGVEGTLSQVVRAFGLRRSRYRGIAKAHLQHVAIAAALNRDRIAHGCKDGPSPQPAAPALPR